MSSSSSSGGVGFFGLLTIVFIVLKLTGYIDWHWFWVLSPVLIPIILVLVYWVFLLLLGSQRTERKESYSNMKTSEILQLVWLIFFVILAWTTTLTLLWGKGMLIFVILMVVSITSTIGLIKYTIRKIKE